jgi:hypothetical protein
MGVEAPHHGDHREKERRELIERQHGLWGFDQVLDDGVLVRVAFVHRREGLPPQGVARLGFGLPVVRAVERREEGDRDAGAADQKEREPAEPFGAAERALELTREREEHFREDLHRRGR